MAGPVASAKTAGFDLFHTRVADIATSRVFESQTSGGC